MPHLHFLPYEVGVFVTHHFWYRGEYRGRVQLYYVLQGLVKSVPAVARLFCLALWGNKNWPPSMKVEKFVSSSKLSPFPIQKKKPDNFWNPRLPGL